MPLEELWQQQPNALGVRDIDSDCDVADSLMDDVYDEVGDLCGDAVLRCIRCDFACRINTLDDERFR